MYEKDQLRDYIEKFALNYMQLLVHPNPPSLLFGADKDTGLNKLQYSNFFPLIYTTLHLITTQCIYCNTLSNGSGYVVCLGGP